VREYWIVDPENRSIDILTLHLDAFHRIQTASAADRLESPLLPSLSIAAADIFAGLDEVDEGGDEG
jgi:Uma2 family endonuclease